MAQARRGEHERFITDTAQKSDIPREGRIKVSINHTNIERHRARDLEKFNSVKCL